MTFMVARMDGEAMGNEGSSVAGGLRGLLERLFESLERAKLKDLERSIARAANEREVSQRVHRLEAGEASLEESIDLYTEGARLKAHCEARLAAAQARIEKIQLGADGQPSDLGPFDAA